MAQGISPNNLNKISEVYLSQISEHHKKDADGNTIPHEDELDEAKVDQGKDDASKVNTRNQRAFGNRRGSKGGGHTGDDMEARRYNTEKGRGVKMRGKKDKTPVNYHKRDRDKAVDELLGRTKKKEPTYLQKKGRQVDIKRKIKSGYYEEVGIATHSMMMKDKAKKEAMLRMKERDAVAKKLRKEEVKRDEYGDPVGGPKITKKQLKKNLAANTPDEDHTNTTAEGYGSDRVGPALKVARVIDRVNPRPKPNSKRTAMSRALKMASIKKDEKIRKRKENPYSTDKKLKMVATSIRDRVKRKVKSMAANEDYIPEEGYDQIKDRIAMAGGDPSSPKKMDATKYPVSKEIKNQKGKTVLQKQSEKKYGKGKSALDIVKADIRKKHGKGAIMSTKK